MQGPAPTAIRQQLRVGEREEWSTQRGKHREFVIGPLNRSECIADRLHFLSRMERAAAHEQVWYAMSFQSLHIRPGYVGGVVTQTPKQETNVSRLKRHSLRTLALSNSPTTLVHHPIYECRNVFG